MGSRHQPAAVSGTIGWGSGRWSWRLDRRYYIRSGPDRYRSGLCLDYCRSRQVCVSLVCSGHGDRSLGAIGQLSGEGFPPLRPTRAAPFDGFGSVVVFEHLLTADAFEQGAHFAGSRVGEVSLGVDQVEPSIDELGVESDLQSDGVVAEAQVVAETSAP